MTSLQLYILFFNFFGLIVLFVLALLPKRVRVVEKSKDNHERWLLHAIRLFPDGGLALVDLDGIIIECSIEFAKIVNAETTSDCIGRNVDSFHVNPEAHRQMRLSMKRDIVARPVAFNCLDGQCKLVTLSVFDLKGIWLVRLVLNV
jgi:PAS domain-containing protein